MTDTISICECGNEVNSSMCHVSFHFRKPEVRIPVVTITTFTLEVTKSELTKIVLALNLRSNMLHNFADEHLGSDTTLTYREAGNDYSALAIRLNRLL